MRASRGVDFRRDDPVWCPRNPIGEDTDSMQHAGVGRVVLSAEPLGPSDHVRMARVEEAEENI